MTAVALALLLLAGAGVYTLGERPGPDRAGSNSAGQGGAGSENGAPSTTAPPTASARPTPSPTRIPTAAEIAQRRMAGEASAWIVDDRTDLPRRNIPTEDLWIVGDTAVQAIYTRVVAHRLSDGVQLWSVDLPKPVCETPVNATPDGKVVIVLQNVEAWSGVRCNQLRMIDLRTGKAGWHKQLTETGAGDDTIIAHCAISALEKAYDQVREIDPATGKVRWRYRTEPGRRVGQVLSVSPAVITTAHRETHAGDGWVVVLGPDCKARTTIDPRPKGFKHCGDSMDTSANAQACREAVVGGGLVLLGGTDRVGAYDLGTGKLVWGVKAGGGTSYGYFPLRVGPGRTGLVHRLGTYSEAGRVFRVGPGAWTRSRTCCGSPSPPRGSSSGWGSSGRTPTWATGS
ncbi:PQQ-like beta-propeller repeat protein [Streptomyces sp. NBC_00090]|uniref:outer membrane protein assembly factor BamB family protein n=1 Tax=Streptomyces sp. NBC_00090 TaxID=2903619 RepID=UPI0032492C94